MLRYISSIVNLHFKFSGEVKIRNSSFVGHRFISMFTLSNINLPWLQISASNGPENSQIP